MGATAFLAVNTYQKVGMAVVVVLVVGWIVFGLSHLRRAEAPPPGSEVELAPNRKPYLDDDSLEGWRLTRSLAGAFVVLVVIGVGLPAYWLREPSRQEGAHRGFDERSAERGHILFQPNDSPVPPGNWARSAAGGGPATPGRGGRPKTPSPAPWDPTSPQRQVT